MIMYTAQSVFHLDSEIVRTGRMERRSITIPWVKYAALLEGTPAALRDRLASVEPDRLTMEYTISGQLLADLCAHKLRSATAIDPIDGEKVRRLLRELALLYKDA